MSDDEIVEGLMLERMEPQEETVILSTDGAYPTSENQKLAEGKNVQVVSTNMAGRKANDMEACSSVLKLVH